MNTDQLLQYIAAVMNDIFEGVLNAKDLLQDKNKTALLEAIIDALDRLDKTIEDVIPREAFLLYFMGMDEAAASLVESGIVVQGGLALTATGQVASGFRKRMHLEAIDEISGDTLLDLKAAIRTAKENAGIAIERTLESVKEDIAKGMIMGDHNKVVSKKVAKSFAENGLTSFITKDGKKLPLDFYARTVTKTKMKVAHTTGAVNRYVENGINLVKVGEHHPTCIVCSRYQGMVIDLTGETSGFKSVNDAGVKLPPYHPNCEHSIRPYVIKYKTAEEIKAEKEKWKRFNPEKDNRTPAQKKAYEKEQAIRREANKEKKQYAKMKAAMGDKAPKTIGAYRRMKRKNDEKWKQLQSDYLSATHSMNNGGTSS
jgi:hypothetical protein